MTTPRYVADCRKFPSDSNCSLLVAGTEEELLPVLEQHVTTVHGHQKTPELRDELRKSLEKEGTSASERNRELLELLYDAFNRRDFALMERATAPEAVITNIASGEVFRGPKGLRAYCEGWVRAMPDANVKVERVLGNEVGYTAEFTGTGTMKGPLSTPGGTIPPNGQRITLRFAEIGLVQNGQVTETHVYFDALSMMKQLGIGAPPPAATATEGTQPAATHRH